jgi:hypothetical protein
VVDLASLDQLPGVILRVANEGAANPAVNTGGANYFT